MEATIGIHPCGGVDAGTAYKIGELGPETFVAGMDGAIIPNMKSMLNRMPDIAQQLQDQMATMGAPMTEAAKTAMATMPKGGSVEEKLDILNQTMLQLVNINTMHKDIGNKQLPSSSQNHGKFTKKINQNYKRSNF